jgi:preprotein translocase subunit YajC
MQGVNVIFAQATSSTATPAAPAVPVQTTAAQGTPVTAGQPQQAPSMLPSLGFMVLLFVVFYFLMIRPQQKQRKEHELMLSQIKAGDRVITSGGIYGTVTTVTDKTVMVRVSENSVIELARGAISGKVVEDAK